MSHSRLRLGRHQVLKTQQDKLAQAEAEDTATTLSIDNLRAAMDQ